MLPPCLRTSYCFQTKLYSGEACDPSVHSLLPFFLSYHHKQLLATLHSSPFQIGALGKPLPCSMYFSLPYWLSDSSCSALLTLTIHLTYSSSASFSLAFRLEEVLPLCFHQHLPLHSLSGLCCSRIECV